MSEEDVSEVVEQFVLPGPVQRVQQLARGHIHDSFVVHCRTAAGGNCRFLLQRLNHRVFTDPALLMRNIERVTAHLETVAAPGERNLRLVPACGGGYGVSDASGRAWRLFEFIEASVSLDRIQSAAEAFALGDAFGRLQRRLCTLDPATLADPLPGLHDTPQRYQQLLTAIDHDRVGRCGEVGALIEFACARQPLVGVLTELAVAGEIPLRIAHNDAKLDNVLFDTASGDPVCVIDLDTVSPGLWLHDYGDLVRTASGSFDEDTTELDSVAVELELFGALTAGYVRHTHELLSAAEREHLVFAAALITYETGLRFLTDHLQGDVYFQTHRPGHNLDRCRVQFRLLESIERQRDVMTATVQACLREASQ